MPGNRAELRCFFRSAKSKGGGDCRAYAIFQRIKPGDHNLIEGEDDDGLSVRCAGGLVYSGGVRHGIAPFASVIPSVADAVFTGRNYTSPLITLRDFDWVTFDRSSWATLNVLIGGVPSLLAGDCEVRPIPSPSPSPTPTPTHVPPPPSAP